MGVPGYMWVVCDEGQGSCCKSSWGRLEGEEVLEDGERHTEGKSCLILLLCIGKKASPPDISEMLNWFKSKVRRAQESIFYR